MPRLRSSGYIEVKKKHHAHFSNRHPDSTVYDNTGSSFNARMKSDLVIVRDKNRMFRDRLSLRVTKRDRSAPYLLTPFIGSSRKLDHHVTV